MVLEERAEQYRDQGYFIVDDAVEPGMLEHLAEAAQKALAKVRSGEVVDDEEGVSTGGEGAEPTSITGLITPEFDEPVFAEYLGSEPVARYLQPLIGDELRMGWVHLHAIRGSYHGDWHRDTGGNERDGSYEVEMEILGRHRRHFVKWHMALVEDPCLWIVPGSHRRYRTDFEREVLINDNQAEIPGAANIVLKKGQTIFWNSNTIHRGKKPEGMGDRSTLMGALINHSSGYDRGEKGEQRWMLAENIRDALPESTRRYYDNWRSVLVPCSWSKPTAFRRFALARM